MTRLTRAIAVFFLTLSLILVGRSAVAAPVEYEFTLTANWFGDDPPVFGFTSLPATPFVGHFTVDSANLAPNSAYSVIPTIDFALTVGTVSFDEAFVAFISRATDASGVINRLTVFAGDGDTQLAIHFNDNGLEGWSVWDQTVNGPCGVSGIGKCFGGFGPDPGFGGVTLAQVPEPATLALFGAGIAVLGVARRRSRR